MLWLLKIIFLSLITYHLSLITSFPVQALYDPNLPPAKTEYVANEIIVKYKPNKTPEELRAQVFEKQKRGRNFFGALQNFGGDLIAKATRQSTPEENLASQQKINSKFKIFQEEKIFETTRQNVLGATTKESPLDDYYLLKSSQTEVGQAIKEFSQDKTVELAEPNYLYHIMATPNDPYFPQLWGLSKIEAPAAWDVSTGSESVIVAVIDGGINYNHEDFNSNLIIKGPDYVYGDNDPMDGYGHGTHVAGTIGAIGNNNIGVVGVNWRVKLMAIKVCYDSRDCSVAAIAQGIQYAADNGANVVNMSVGGANPSTIMQQTVEYAYNKGVVLVGAAGNCVPTCAVIYPARYPEVIAVAATDPSDRRAAFSSYGDTVEVAAPGVSILSTTGSDYQTMNGTSMASPHVAGLAGLILSKNPSFTPQQVREILTSTADDLGTAGRDPYYGYGRINAAKALGAAGTTPTVTPGGLTSTPTPSPTPTLPPGVTPTATLTPSPTPTPPSGATPTATSTPAPGQITSLRLEVMLQGINSQKPDKEFTVKIKQESREVVKTTSFSSDDKGIYSNEISLADENLQNGIFDILIKTAYFLQKKFGGITLGEGENTVTRLADEDLLRAGDINNSGVVDREDVNLLKSAYSPFNFTTNPADLNLNNLVNSLDYSLLISNYGRSDDTVPTPTITSTPTSTPTSIPSFTPTPSLLPTATLTPSPTPSSPCSTSTPTLSPTLTNTPTPTPT